MYSPKIKEELVRKLYQLKQQTHRPMTSLANEAIENYLEQASRHNTITPDKEIK